ncbi:MAG: N-acetylmuramoyl-L-alanine amidase [Clostridia bacterium]|nr:N-acetylmuramoyl-L-alanine amidase [Clostridia bacterium]
MGKRWITAVLVACILLISFGSVSVAVSDFVAGCDLDGDGRVNSADARLLLRKSARLAELSETDAAKRAGVLVFGDVNGDGKVNSTDARLLLRYTARLSPESALTIRVKAPESSATAVTTVPPSTDSGTQTTRDSELVDIPTDPPVTLPTTTIPPTTVTLPTTTVPPVTTYTPVQPDISEQRFVASLPHNSLLSPYSDHGLGTAKMVITKSDYAEMTPANSGNLRSYPLMNPYISGMIDYVTAATTDTYHLESGAKIELKDADYLPAGYKMPTNRLSVAGILSGSDATAIYFKTDWKVPICVQFRPQSYFEGYEGRAYNLRAFTAEYMQVQFYYTGGIDGSFSFPAGSVFDGATVTTAAATGVTTLRLNLSKVGGFYGYDISYTGNGYLRIAAKNPEQGLAGKTIVLDPGHGGSDVGGGDRTTGVYEAPINFKVCTYLQELLTAAGANVVMTRTGDDTVSLAQRVAITRRNNADLFMSVHGNEASTATASGVEVYYYYPFSMPYAQCLQTALVNAYRSGIYASGTENYNRADREIRFYPMQVARVETCPAVLVELGFLTNAVERAAMQSDVNQQLLAQGLFDGIRNYFALRD